MTRRGFYPDFEKYPDPNSPRGVALSALLSALQIRNLTRGEADEIVRQVNGVDVDTKILNDLAHFGAVRLLFRGRRVVSVCLTTLGRRWWEGRGCQVGRLPEEES